MQGTRGSPAITEVKIFTVKRWFILGAVFLHFLGGVLNGLPAYYYIKNELPIFRPLIKIYEALSWDQDWTMFAPPPRTIETIKFSAVTNKGFGPLTQPFEEMEKKAARSLILPRGQTRIEVLLRSDPNDWALEKSHYRKFFFQQLSAYYCFGDGKIPGILGIRFYLQIKGIPRFYPNDKWGNPLPPASDLDGVIPIYERDCSKI